jgi:hypothetical protein
VVAYKEGGIRKEVIFDRRSPIASRYSYRWRSLDAVHLVLDPRRRGGNPGVAPSADAFN